MSLSKQDFELFRAYVNKLSGLVINEDKQYLIESRLAPIMREIKAHGYQDFYQKIQADKTLTLQNRVVDAITTHETLWFRDGGPWRVFEEVILPNFAEQMRKGHNQRFKVWSAASSTGQEAYSLAMLIDNNICQGKLPGLRPEHFEILGTDISSGAIETAIAGRYNQLEMNRGLALEYKTKYFSQVGNICEIEEKMRRRVKFRTLNLQDDFLSLGRMDVILCRNVLIYFSEEFKNQLMRRFAMLMNPGSYFLLGSTESGLGHSHTFDMREHKSSIYYQLKKI